MATENRPSQRKLVHFFRCYVSFKEGNHLNEMYQNIPLFKKRGRQIQGITHYPHASLCFFHSSCGSNTAHCAISAETKAGDDGDGPQNQKRAPHLDAEGSWNNGNPREIPPENAKFPAGNSQPQIGKDVRTLDRNPMQCDVYTFTTKNHQPPHIPEPHFVGEDSSKLPQCLHENHGESMVETWWNLDAQMPSNSGEGVGILKEAIWAKKKNWLLYRDPQ